MKAKPSPKGAVLELGPQDSPLLEKSAALPFHIRNILVPVDFSEASRKALIYAARFAEVFDASLNLLHIVEIPMQYGAVEGGVLLTDPVTVQTLQQDAEKQIRSLLEDLRRLGGKAVQVADSAKIRIRSGVPFSEIAETAREQHADLLVISTHGRTGLKRLFMGSTAERVVRHAPCPVLVVREHEVDFLETSRAH